tara:strand:- start:34021 stop:34623 length:603 start_codon:yes stop_codon:yes gene_type:complete
MNPSRLELAIKNKDLKMIDIIFKEDNIHSDFGMDFEEINSIEVLEHITSKIKLSDNTLEHIMFNAFKDNNIDLFIHLILRCKIDPSFSNNILLREISKEGKIGFLKVLLSNTDINPSANDNDAINSAIIKDQETVALHLSRQKDVYEDKSIHRSIRFAFINKMFSVVFELWKHEISREHLKFHNKKLYDKINKIKSIRDF